MENDEAKKMCIMNNIDKYFNSDMMNQKIISEKMSYSDYYDKYLKFLGNDIIDIIRSVESTKND